MRRLALLSVTLFSLVAGCSDSEGPFVVGGRCRCPGGSYCVQQTSNSGPAAALVCEAVAAQTSCSGLTNESRYCWGSKKAAGLCVCTSIGDKLAAR
jgi:hypothetical protein